MIWGLIGVLVVLFGALGWQLSAGRRGRVAEGVLAATNDRLDPAETASIGAALESIGHAHTETRNRRLTMLVGQLIDRRVPVRVIELVAGHAEARVRFADGTTIRACGTTDGDLGLLAGVIREGSVTPALCAADRDGVHIVFDRTARQVIGPPRRLSIRVIGIDQPD
ncbi:MAG: hypothetical protein ABIR32_01265 [Ilumatobacteraceae bacterium]